MLDIKTRYGALPALTKDEECALVARAKGGDRVAMERIVRTQILWVAKIARRYSRGDEDKLQEYIAIGSVGVVRAVEKFEPERGYRLTTYAANWIRHFIARSIENNDMVRLPVHYRQRVGAPPHHLSLDAPIGDEEGGATYLDQVVGHDGRADDVIADMEYATENELLVERLMSTLTPQEQEVIRRRFVSEDTETLQK